MPNLGLGRNLKHYRDIKKVSQDQLAELVGVSRGTISKYEADQSEPKLEYLIKFSEMFGITLDELILEIPRNQVNESPAEYKTRIQVQNERIAELEALVEQLKEDKSKLQARLIDILEEVNKGRK